MTKRTISYLASLAPLLAIAASNPYFALRDEKSAKITDERRERMKNDAAKRAVIREQRPKHVYIIHGHEIEAYSKKDAIKRLQHQGLLK